MKNSIKFLKRFFEPALVNKLSTSKMLFEGSVTTLWFDVLPLFFIPHLIILVDKKNILEIYVFMFFISFLYILLWIIGYKIRHWDFEAKYVFEAEIEKLYRSKSVLKSGLEMDKIGTGKVQSIIQKGIIKWADGIWQIIYQVPRLFFGIASGFYVTLSFGYSYLLLFIIFVFISSFLYYFYRKKELKFEESLNELDNEMTSQSVKMIMSRQEISFSDSVDVEVSKLLNINKKQKELQKMGQKYDFAADLSISGTVVVLPFLVIILTIFTKDIFSLNGVLVIALIYFASRFSTLMGHLVWAVRQFLDVWPQVKSFWNFIDNVPQIKNYENGKMFEHKTGEIVLKDVSFSYQKQFSK
jgi:ABC-type multidrug transport system fused ATPase/permease subunit